MTYRMNEEKLENKAVQNRYLDQCVERVFGHEGRTYLMGIAMIWIVLFHVYFWGLTSGIDTPWWIRLFDRATIGVDILFALSAFGLQASMERNPVSRFYFNRFTRLFPVYFLFLLVLFLTFERDCPIDRVLIQSVGQITGISLFKYPEFFSCNFCFDWFTPAIILFYIGFPLLHRAVSWINKKGIVVEMVVLAVLVFIAVWIRVNKHFMFGLLALRMPIIYLVMTSYIYIKQHESQKILSLCIWGACLGLLSSYEAMALSLITPILLIVYSMTDFKLPFKRLISLIGKYSYEVYLAHIFAVAFFIPMKTVTNVFVLLAITIGSTIVIAALFAYVQSKFQSRLRQVH